MKPAPNTHVYTSDNSGGEFVVANVTQVENPLNHPAPLPKGGADSVLSLPLSQLVKAARENKVRQLMMLIRLKMEHPGKAALRKADVPKWKQIVKAGYSREGRTHVHLASFNKRGLTVRIKKEWLDQDPLTVAFMVLQAYKLRCVSLTGRTRQARKRNLRLVVNENSGGVCLDMMAAMFGRTRQWASWMRRRIEKAGWAMYSRRWVACSESEAYICKQVGQAGRVSRSGFREVASRARLNEHPLFKWSYRPRKGVSL